MDAKKQVDQLELPCLEENSFSFRSCAVIDLLESSMASFQSRLKGPPEFPQMPDDLKLLGLHALDHALELDGVAGSVGVLVRSDAEGSTMTDEEDSDTMSDAGTYDLWEPEVADEQEGDDAFSRESVRRKLEVLASMVGTKCIEPGFVLGEVVRVLKELDQKMGIRCHNIV